LINQPTKGEKMIDLAKDMATKMVPSEGDVKRAVAAIEANGTEFAVTPMVFVGKEWGFWTEGVEVETSTLVYACNNNDSYSAARNEACVAGAKMLGERPGTVGYATHRIVDGVPRAAMFEDIISPLDHLKRDADPAGL
jgi:hypothetical protein